MPALTPADRLARLTRWLRQAGVDWPDDRVSLRVSPYGGFGVFACQDIAEGAVLATIPKTAVLSVKTSGARDVLREARLGGGLGLVVAVMYERAMGARSPWYEYLQSFGDREYVPLFWSAAELELLRGTEAEARVASDARLAEEDFSTHVLPMAKDFPGRMPRHALTLDNFRAAASWVSSRAFGVDEHHGISLTPLADVFNHKTAVVDLSADYIVNPVCYAASDAELSDDDSDSQSDDLPAQEKEQPCGYRPTMTRGSQLGVGARSQYQLEIGICDTGSAGKGGALEIVAACSLAAGAEIHNTYGELGNEDLVVRYGFSVLDNPFSFVRLDKATLLRLATEQLGERTCRRRTRFLLAESELLNVDLEPFEVLPDGFINASLHAALFVLLAEEQSFASWTGMSDVLLWLQATPAEMHVEDSPPCPDQHKLAQCSSRASSDIEAHEAVARTAQLELATAPVLSLSKAMKQALVCALYERVLQHPETSAKLVYRQLVAAQKKVATSARELEAVQAKVAALGLQHCELRILAAALASLGCTEVCDTVESKQTV